MKITKRQLRRIINEVYPVAVSMDAARDPAHRIAQSLSSDLSSIVSLAANRGLQLDEFKIIEDALYDYLRNEVAPKMIAIANKGAQ